MQVPEPEVLAHKEVTGVHVAVVLDDHIVAAFLLELADLWTVPGVGEQEVVKETDRCLGLPVVVPQIKDPTLPLLIPVLLLKKMVL